MCCFSSRQHKLSSLNHGRAANRTHSFASPLFQLCFIYQVLQQFMLQLMLELKLKVTVLPSEKNICFSLTAACPTCVRHLTVKPGESFLTLVFNTHDITECHDTAEEINGIPISVSLHYLPSLLLYPRAELIFYPYYFHPIMKAK